MKQTILIALLTFSAVFISCQNAAQEKAKETANAIQETMTTFSPPQVATSADGYFMKATVNGKPWVAKSMMEINASNTEFVRGDDGQIQIAFYIDRDHIRVGKARKFYSGHSADLNVEDNLMSARSGEWIITKSDDSVIEGTFHFSAESTINGSKGEVSNRTFRILLKKK
ncbi:MAG: hypothetical protein J5I50_08425 [Chitinophagaceae bacterium]|nr:hypothetical protein [Chitinophagaceae bacterium]